MDTQAMNGPRGVCKLLLVGILSLAAGVRNLSNFQKGAADKRVVFDYHSDTFSSQNRTAPTSSAITALTRADIRDEELEADPEAISHRPTATIISDPKPCRILISNRAGDFHYEILESVALQYPLPWDQLGTQCHEAGLHSNESAIIVDFFLDFKYKGYSNRTEAWGWNEYFQNHLQGHVVHRHARRRDDFKRHDERWIRYGSVVDHSMSGRPSSSTNVDWKMYDATIEANCGFITNWDRGLYKNPHAFCVLHRAHRNKIKAVASQSCHLNPQHAPRCWFVPSDFPSFSTPDPPSTTRPLRACIGWKAEKKKEHRDLSLIAKALTVMQPENLKLFVIGRKARVPHQIQQANLSHYVVLESTQEAFYDYQQTLARCHVLIPLVHPDGASNMYFLGSKEDQVGKLSGTISQTIGNGIPSVIHTAVADIYRELFTAPIFEYKETEDPKSFINAFHQMLEYYNATNRKMIDQI